MLSHIFDCLFGSFHVESPFLLPRVDIGEMQQLRKQLKTVLNEPLGSLSDMILDFFWDLVEMVEFVPYDTDEVSH